MDKLVITGAAGFIGTNLSLALQGLFDLVLIDDLSRSGSQKNLQLLNQVGLDIKVLDVANESELHSFLKKTGKIDGLVHLAAQTSLIESLKNPKHDFDVNALGTLNLLEYLRRFCPDCVGVFLSSNKVYGNLNSFDYEETQTRFSPASMGLSFDESLSISPIGGYSISKAVSDYYVNEYGKRFSMPVVSLRQSAVYGRNQNSRSDQGWVSYFTNEISSRNSVNLRGNGKQVRDILYIDDFIVLIQKILKSKVSPGESYNVGGGFDFSLSILELFNILEDLTTIKAEYVLGEMSPEDQKYFVSNNSKIYSLTGWTPKVGPRDGIARLLE
jgi:CDP-paratose 2-epimerase